MPAHPPPPGVHLTRLYGAYANRTRGAPDLPRPSQRERRRAWARLIAKVFDVDLLRCPCGASMRVVGFILDPAVIRTILAHRPRLEARAHAPPDG